MDPPGPRQDQQWDGRIPDPLSKLHLMLYHQDFKAADALVTADPSILHLRFGPAFPQLSYIAGSGYPESLEWLLKWDVLDVNEGDKLGHTALLNACKRGDCEIVTMLLEKGADITIPAKHGDTPIMEATVSHSTNVMKLLLDYLLSSWGRRRSSAAGGGKREEEEEEQEEQEGECEALIIC